MFYELYEIDIHDEFGDPKTIKILLHVGFKRIDAVFDTSIDYSKDEKQLVSFYSKCIVNETDFDTSTYDLDDEVIYEWIVSHGKLLSNLPKSIKANKTIIACIRSIRGNVIIAKNIRSMIDSFLIWIDDGGILL